MDAVDGKDLRKAYDDRMAKEHARDKYDAEHHGGARLAGQLGATAVQLVATGGVPGVAKLAGLGGEAVLGLRMKQATPLALREIGTVAGVGAGTGVAGQGVADALSGKVSGLGDYAGAAVGGAVAAPVALKFHGAHAGAAGGAATSLAQDMFNGRIRSVDDWVPAIVNAQQAASLGAITGGVATGAAAKRVDALDRRAKGRLGEDLSELRTAARGEKTVPGGKTREYLSEGWTVPDSRSTDWGGETADIIESKFGRSHKQLKGRQAQAYRELPNYRVDHFLPRDIGAIFGVPAAELAYLTGLNFDRE
ncbi:hypothetical protein [Phenylobacterium sp. J367]|uniref:hypothetical protein n=1 Tax=Phenylobacterium sp. J367 TaxID=2898435 RepID=UPI002151D951|nr:hypothetical protein [Phenylobacterium sp. J367]MCR5879431.1 hypothetical protein [Phenylobacterium sp. J367]